MRKILLDIFIAVILCILLLVCLRIIASLSPFFQSNFGKDIYKILQSSIILFCLFTIGYKRIWEFKKLNKRSFWLAAIGALIFIIIYNFVSVHKNIVAYYNYFTGENFIAWPGKIYQNDPLLGYKPKASAKGAFLYNKIPSIPIRINEAGFRVPVFDDSLSKINNSTDLLFLGCSFTFGSAVKAEDAFPHIVAHQTNQHYINAGAGGYGLSQMYILSEMLIRKYKPSCIVLQYSPWLISRSLEEFAPSKGGYLLPTPYFSAESDSFKVQPPVFESTAASLEPAEDRKAYSGKFIKYYFEKGLVYFSREQWKLIIVRLQNLFSKRKRPTGNRSEAQLFAYRKIFELSAKHHVNMILLKINGQPFSEDFRKLIETNNVCIANADSLLYRRLGSASKEKYAKAYYHWGFNGNDSVLVDLHPNILAHKIISEAVLQCINKKF